MKKILLLCLTLLLLNSCASTPKKLITETYTGKWGKGMLVGSVAIENEKPIFNNYFI